MVPVSWQGMSCMWLNTPLTHILSTLTPRKFLCNPQCTKKLLYWGIRCPLIYICGYRHMNLEDSLIPCPFNWETIVGLPLGPAISDFPSYDLLARFTVSCMCFLLWTVCSQVSGNTLSILATVAPIAHLPRLFNCRSIGLWLVKTVDDFPHPTQQNIKHLLVPWTLVSKKRVF